MYFKLIYLAGFVQYSKAWKENTKTKMIIGEVIKLWLYECAQAKFLGMQDLHNANQIRTIFANVENLKRFKVLAYLFFTYQIHITEEIAFQDAAKFLSVSCGIFQDALVDSNHNTIDLRWEDLTNPAKFKASTIKLALNKSEQEMRNLIDQWWWKPDGIQQYYKDISTFESAEIEMIEL